MADLTPDRLQELRRIAEAATPGPWAWRMSKDGRILDLITLETGYNEEIITPSHINAWLQVKGGLKDFIPAFAPATALALLDRVEQLEADNNKLERENGELYRRIERLEAKLARQRVVLRHLQMAVERRNSQERIEALRRKLSDEKRLLDRIDALEAMLLRLYQDTVVPDTHYCHRCGVIGGHDESCAMAEVEVLLGLTGGATHA